MTEQTEMEIAGVKFKGGKIFLVLTALTTVGGGLWAGFEFYKDYMDMKAIIQTIDTDAIEARNKQLDIKLEQAIDYTRDIKTGLRDDILGIEKQVDRMEDKLRKSEEIQRSIIQNAEERFENKRDALQNDYNQSANRLKEQSTQRSDDITAQVKREMKELELRLNKRLQRALDNPLANQVSTCMKNTNKKVVEINLGWEKQPAPAVKKTNIKSYMARQIAIQPSKPTNKKQQLQ